MKIWGITGWKNTGKTALVERLVAEFSARGLRVSTIKHAHHTADVDRPGTDSHRHRAAGSVETILATPMRFAIMHEIRGGTEPGLGALLERLSPVDLVIVEGFKRDPHPKIECWRDSARDAPRADQDDTIRAIATDAKLEASTRVLDLNDTQAIADFIVAELKL